MPVNIGMMVKPSCLNRESRVIMSKDEKKAACCNT